MDLQSGDVLSTMPREVLHEIFSKLNKRDLGSTAEANLHFREVVKSDGIKLFKLRDRLEKYGGKLDKLRRVDLDTLLTLSEYLDGRGTSRLAEKFNVSDLILEFAAYAVFGLDSKFLSFDDKMIQVSRDGRVLSMVISSGTMSFYLNHDLIRVLMGLDTLNLLNTDSTPSDILVASVKYTSLLEPVIDRTLVDTSVAGGRYNFSYGESRTKAYIRAILERYNPGLLTRSKWISDITASDDMIKDYIREGYENHVEQRYRDSFITEDICDILDSWGISYLPSIVESVQGEHRILDLIYYYENIYGDDQIGKLRRHKSYNRLRDADTTNIANTSDIEFVNIDNLNKMMLNINEIRIDNREAFRRFDQTVILSRDKDMITEILEQKQHWHTMIICDELDGYLSGIR